jgi:Helix-turn-helix domain
MAPTPDPRSNRLRSSASAPAADGDPRQSNRRPTPWPGDHRGGGNAATARAAKHTNLPDVRMDKGRHVKGTERAAWTRNLVARYDAGESIRDLVTASGRSYRNIRDLLLAGGAAIRSRSGGPRRHRASHVDRVTSQSIGSSAASEVNPYGLRSPFLVLGSSLEDS